MPNRYTGPEALADRFWRYVNKTDGCWLWTGATNTYGYGVMSVATGHGKGKTVGAHRISWELHNGPIPDGRHLLHACDTPPCVRPDHLIPGSQQDNMRDMRLKRRGWWTKPG